MRRALTAGLLAALAAMGGRAATGGPACVPLAGDQVSGKDLAAAVPEMAALDPGLVVSLSPAPGVERHFFASELGRLAARAGISVPEGGFRAVCFVRPVAALPREAVAAALAKALGDTGAQLELLDYCRIPIPVGTLEFTPSGLALPPGGSVRVPVIWRGRLRYSPSRSVPVWARVRVWVRRQHLVATQALVSGTLLEARHLRLEQADESPFLPAGPSRQEEVTGRLLRRSLAPGQALSTAGLTEAPAVNRGDGVEVEARNGTAMLRFQAKAESSGRIGDTILVLNPESRRRFRAIVSGKGTVVVDETLASGQRAASRPASGQDRPDGLRPPEQTPEARRADRAPASVGMEND